MTICVLTVRSSCSLGPSWISWPMSLPSAADASSSVARTAACPPQASSMPTDCEPCPGKTNAKSAMLVCLLLFLSRAASEVEQHGTPGEATADAFEQHGVAALDAAALDRHVQRQRHRRGRGVAVFV